MTLTSKLFGGAWGWLTSHARLVIEYTLIALIVVLGAAVLYGRIHAATQDTQLAKQAGQLDGFTAQLETATSTIHQQVAVNEAQQAALDKLAALRDADSVAITGLQRDIQLVDSKRAALRAKLAELEKNNAQAKHLLDTPVPSALGCVLDSTPCPAATGHDADKH